MEDSSLSQGIFFQKPKSKRKANGKEAYKLNYLDVFEEPVETASLRFTSYHRHLKHIRDKIEDLENTWHSEVVNEVVTFIDDSSRSMFQSELVTPIGFLQSGLSADENSKLFDSIQTAIKEGKTPYLARLNSTNCPNVKTAFQNICKQLIRNDTNVSYFPEESFISQSSVQDEYSQTLSSSKYLSIHDLQQWYEVGHPKYFKNSFMKNSPSLTAMNNKSRNPVVSLRRIESVKVPVSNSSSQSVIKAVNKARKSLNPIYENESCLTPEKKARVQNEIESESIDKEEIRKFLFTQDINTNEGSVSPSRQLRSTPKKLQKSDSYIVNASTPLSHGKMVKRFEDGDSPENKHPNSDATLMLSPITTHVSSTPKRVSLSVQCKTPKNRTPFRNFLTPTTGGASGTGSTKQLPIVLIIEDVDYCPSNVIQQILQLLSCAKLPMILIVGVINCYESFNRFIPQQCSTTLMYKAFSTRTGSKRLNDFFVKIMLDAEFPLVLSGNVVEYMSNYFLLHNFSATRLLQAYQLCLIDYYSQSKSILISGGNLSKVPSSVLLEVLNDVDVKAAKHNSIRSPTKNKAPLPDTEDIKTNALKLVKKFSDSTIEWFVGLYFLFGIREKLPDSLGNDIRELYILSYHGGLFQEEHDGQMRIEETLKIVGIFGRRQLETTLEKTLRYMKEFLMERDLNETEEITSLFSKVENFIFKLKHCDEEEKKLAEQSKQESVDQPSIKLRKKKFASALELRDALKTQIESKKTGKVFVDIRNSFLQFFKTFIRKHLSAFPDKPNAKIFTFDNVTYLQHYFSPISQKRVCSALLLPGKFLQCKCCAEMSSESMHHSLPDTSIVYKLIVERNTKIIDLNELYRNFESIIDSRRASVSKKHINDPHLLRFRQTIAELQHIGLIQRAKRKPDEITRQNW